MGAGPCTWSSTCCAGEAGCRGRRRRRCLARPCWRGCGRSCGCRRAGAARAQQLEPRTQERGRQLAPARIPQTRRVAPAAGQRGFASWYSLQVPRFQGSPSPSRRAHCGASSPGCGTRRRPASCSSRRRAWRWVWHRLRRCRRRRCLAALCLLRAEAPGCAGGCGTRLGCLAHFSFVTCMMNTYFKCHLPFLRRAATSDAATSDDRARRRPVAAGGGGPRPPSIFSTGRLLWMRSGAHCVS